MKNQYFGDNKDLFTYDLAYWIQQAGLVNHFTFIPMLTMPDGSSDGSKTDRTKAGVGTQHQKLVDFLDECVRENRRDIRQLERFFSEHEQRMTIYSGKDRYFSHRKRQEYFNGIRIELLLDSLILVSPDNGLEVNRSRERHLLFSEVKDLYQRMAPSSILMIFQHFPRQDHHEYLHRRAEELAEKVCGEVPLSIDDNEAIFFFLTKDEEFEDDLAHLLEHYAKEYV